MRPPAHHVIGHFGVELQANCMPAVAIGLIGEIRPANSEELGAFREIESVGMPLVDGTRESRGAETFARGRRLDRVIADLAALVFITEHARAEHARQHLGAEAKTERRLVFGERCLEPVDLAPDPVEPVVGAHRAFEHHDAVMLRERRRQLLAATWPANVEPCAHGLERHADSSRGRTFLVQDDQNGRASSEAPQGHGHELLHNVAMLSNRDPKEANSAPQA
jgi:hypothetical protein